jgi:hypothetical protein
MTYFILTYKIKNYDYSALWKIDEDGAIRIGIVNAKTAKGCYYEAQSGKSIFEVICSGLSSLYEVSNFKHHKIELNPGQYYIRMARPNDQIIHESPGNNPGAEAYINTIASSLGQLDVLVRQLKNICQVIHPAKTTLLTYGHAIRNVLILAATEVESHWRGILFDNGIIKDKYSTFDYVLLKDALRLDEYSVSFPTYPWLDPLRPFENWNKDRPTGSLIWYDAYNAVKHDREGQFERATLSSAFEAVAACAVLLVAQFSLHPDGWHFSDSHRFFNFNSTPKWGASDVYTYPYEQDWADGHVTWTAVQYPFKK